MEPRSSFEAVEAELRARARAADEAGDSEECLLCEELASVADFLRRLALPTASAHYRCEKSFALLQAALLVQQRAFQAYADRDVSDRIVVARRLVDDAARAVTHVLWDLTGPGSGREVTTSSAERADGVARSFRVWADQLSAEAVPDEEDLF